MSRKTLEQYDRVLERAREMFRKKNHDYGDSFRLLRLSSLTDQIYVKVKRIRQLEEMEDSPRVPEGVETEYLDILNYSILALMKLEEGGDQSVEEVEKELHRR